MDNVDDILEHYGIKGMKWGVRKASTISADAGKVKASRKTIKKQGTQALSNKDLKEVVTRMNLENQYRSLTKTKSFADRVADGRKQAETLNRTMATLKEVYRIGAPILAAFMAAGYVAKKSGYSAQAYRVYKPAGAVAGKVVKSIAR